MGVLQVETFDIDVAANGTYTLSNTLASTSSGFVRNTNPRKHSAGPIGNTSNADPNDMSGYAYVSSTSQLTVGRLLGTVKMAGEVWRYTGSAGGDDEFIVRDRLQVTLTNAGPATVSVSGIVDRNKCIPFITGKTCTQASRTNMAEMGACAHIDANGDLVVERGSGTSTLVVYVTVVEFTGVNWTVAYSRSGFANQEASLYLDSQGNTGTTASVNWANSLIVECQQAGGNGSNDAIEDMSFVASPGATGATVNKAIDSGSANTGNGMVYVLENAGISIARTTASKTIPNNNTYVTETFPRITLTNVNEACVEWTVTSDGSGTAHGRGSLSAYLLNTTTLRSWVHRSGNTGTYRYGVADLTGIQGVPAVKITDAPSQIDPGDPITLTGQNFGASQGTGTVYISDTSTVGTGTDVLQTIGTWSDTEITFTANLTGLADGTVYFIVTADNGGSTARLTQKGVLPYTDVIAAQAPDHWWKLDNDAYADSGNYTTNIPMTTDVVGTHTFVTTPISEATTHSWRVQNGRRSPNNSNAINGTTTTNRLMGGWVRCAEVYQGLSCIYEEGGGVNNICFLIGMGNRLIASYADTDDDNAQAFSDFALEPGRDYHIMFRFSHTDATKEFTLWIDGIKQSVTTGNPLTSGDLDAHSGDITFGSGGGSLEVGGTDVTFVNMTDMLYSNWVTWSVSKPEVDIVELFRRGAIPTHTIFDQSDLDALASQTLANAPLCIRVDASVTDLSADGVIFPEEATIWLEWRGAGTLNWTNLNGSNLRADKIYALKGGTVNIINPATLTLTNLQPNTEVRVFVAGTSTELGGVENSGTTFQLSVQTAAVDISIIAIGFQNFRLLGVDTSSDTSLPIQQAVDRVYANP